MESIQDYPSSYTYVSTSEQRMYIVPTTIKDKDYVRVYIEDIVVSDTLYFVQNNTIIFYDVITNKAVVKIKVASSEKGKIQLGFETSQEAVLDSIIKMNYIISKISELRNIRNNLPTINSVYTNLENIRTVSKYLINIKALADNITLVTNPDLFNHATILNRNTRDSHSMDSITGLRQTIDTMQLAGVFPTKRAYEVDIDSDVLAKVDGTVTTLKARDIVSKQYKIPQILNPYAQMGGILRNIKDAYDININKSPRKNSAQLSPINLNTPDLDAVTFSRDRSHYSNYFRIRWGESDEPMLGILTYYNYSNYFGIGIWDCTARYAVASAPVKWVNSTGLPDTTILNGLSSAFEAYKRVVTTKTVSYVIIFLGSTPYVVKNTLTFTNKIFTVTTTIYCTLPANTSVTGWLIIMNNRLYMMNFFTDRTYLDLLANTKHTIRPSLMYNGEEIFYSSGYRPIHTLDSFNSKYIAYYSRIHTSTMYFVDIEKTLTTSPIDITSVYKETSLVSPALSRISAGYSLGGTTYVTDRDAKNLRFIYAFADPREENGYAHYVDIESGVDYRLNIPFKGKAYSRVYLLPRGKDGKVYIAYMLDTYVLGLLVDNVPYPSNYNVGNFKWDIYPRGFGGYHSTHPNFLIEEKNVNPNDLHLLTNSLLNDYI